MKAPSHPYCVSAKTKEEEPEKYQAIIKFLKFYYGPEGTAINARDNQSVPVTRYEGEIDAESYPVFAKVMERMNDDWESPETCPNMTLPGQFETTYFESSRYFLPAPSSKAPVLRDVQNSYPYGRYRQTPKPRRYPIPAATLLFPAG